MGGGTSTYEWPDFLKIDLNGYHAWVSPDSRAWHGKW